MGDADRPTPKSADEVPLSTQRDGRTLDPGSPGAAIAADDDDGAKQTEIPEPNEPG